MKIWAQPIDFVREAHEVGVIFCPNGDWASGALVRKLDEATGGALRDLAESQEFRGEKGETALLHTRGSLATKRLLLVGLGPSEGHELERIRAAAGTAARKVQGIRVAAYAVHLPDLAGRGAAGAGGSASAGAAAQAVVEGSLLGLHQFMPYRTREEDRKIETTELRVGTEAAQLDPEVAEGVRAGEIIARASCWARDLALHPANVMTPARLAEEARALAEHAGLTVEVKERSWIEEVGMNGLLAVSQGSHEAPRFIILEHRPEAARGAPVVLVGKGITFDSGGLSLKDREGMGEMKYDMSGAAAVLGTFRATADLDLPVHLVGLVPATENLPGGGAFRPGDVLRMMNGKTVEIISTDAEGRMILADALSYARRYSPAAVVDLATLTGAIVIALGHVAAGLMGNDSALIERLLRAGEASGERAWQMPLWPEYREQFKSEVADMKNVGGRPAGAITAALFLAEFAEGYPWAHLDIAGVASLDREISCLPKGPTGAGVRLLSEFLRSWVKT